MKELGVCSQAYDCVVAVEVRLCWTYPCSCIYACVILLQGVSLIILLKVCIFTTLNVKINVVACVVI